MLFFDKLKREMDIFDYDNLQVNKFDHRGYYAAVDKMNFFVEEFIEDEIKGREIN
jgi:hypothetical protein